MKYTFDNKMIVVRSYLSLYCHIIKFFYHFLCYAVRFGVLMTVSRLKTSDVMPCIFIDRYEMLLRNLLPCIFMVEGDGSWHLQNISTHLYVV
jgi:hypothetical protein